MIPRWNPLSSSVAAKLLIALTGLALFLYLVVHLVGNSLLFLGPDTFNGYAHVLISNPLIIPVEIGLAAIFLLHVCKTVGDVVAQPAGAARAATTRSAGPGGRAARRSRRRR